MEFANYDNKDNILTTCTLEAYDNNDNILTTCTLEAFAVSAISCLFEANCSSMSMYGM